MNRKLRGLTFLSIPMLAGGLVMSTGCEALDKAADACGFTCAVEGVAAGNPSISGVASIDGFFGAAVDFSAQAEGIVASINAELAAIANSVDLEGGAGADFSGGFDAALSTKFGLEGGICVDFSPPQCSIQASVVADAAASCDVEAEPGSVTAECSGGCEAEVAVDGSVECSAEAEVSCTGTAPGFDCTGGTCEGTCSVELTAAASCDGVCDGTCSGSTDAGGKCDGMCQGECKTEGKADAECSGKCEGSCTFTGPDIKCEGGAKAECTASASAEATVSCEGSCSGEVTPPSVSAECEAQVNASADINAECTPPSLEITYTFAANASANADVNAQAEFSAWLTGFEANVASLAALEAKLLKLQGAATGLVSAAGGAVATAALEMDLGDDLGASYKVLNCVPIELEVVISTLGTAGTELTASATATASFMGAIAPAG